MNQEPYNEPHQEGCPQTHYAGCACHERGWQNKWQVAVEMAAQAQVERDELLAAIRAYRDAKGLSVRIDEQLVAKLKRICKARGVTQARWISERIEELQEDALGVTEPKSKD